MEEETTADIQEMLLVEEGMVEEGVQEEAGVRMELLDRELWHQFRYINRTT